MKKSKLQVAVIGAGGRMGQEIGEVLSQRKDTRAQVGVVRKGEASGFERSETSLSAPALKKADVWIDFSTLESFSANVKAAVQAGRPLVSGVTGLTEKHLKELELAGKKIPVLWSPNMSFGIAALRKALAVAAELEDFDFQIEEFHHRHKKDKPSGTAIYLQKTLAQHVKGKLPEPLAVRGGGIFGVHKVWMMSEEETICFEHQALNRRVFAKGAVQAAVWLANRKPGLYTMDDLFGGF
ncbi:MAG: 4-hydroxy-tetrahydrodipicolinate reductase [Bdellovibrionaceae bacterium]|nr:4-hydroxy-tetrahydrodipicolinate reductase [Pseudobdellovibrionaceae bacterium]